MVGYLRLSARNGQLRTHRTGPTFGSFIDSTEPIFERMNRFSVEPSKSGRTSAVCDYYNPRAGYGGKATTAIKCSNDEEVLKAVCENAGRHDFVFARLMELNHAQGCEHSLFVELE